MKSKGTARVLLLRGRQSILLEFRGYTRILVVGLVVDGISISSRTSLVSKRRLHSRWKRCGLPPLLLLRGQTRAPMGSRLQHSLYRNTFVLLGFMNKEQKRTNKSPKLATFSSATEQMAALPCFIKRSKDSISGDGSTPTFI